MTSSPCRGALDFLVELHLCLLIHQEALVEASLRLHLRLHHVLSSVEDLHGVRERLSGDVCAAKC
jgi:hypothetical protein